MPVILQGLSGPIHRGWRGLRSIQSCCAAGLPAPARLRPPGPGPHIFYRLRGCGISQGRWVPLDAMPAGGAGPASGH